MLVSRTQKPVKIQNYKYACYVIFFAWYSKERGNRLFPNRLYQQSTTQYYRVNTNNKSISFNHGISFTAISQASCTQRMHDCFAKEAAIITQHRKYWSEEKNSWSSPEVWGHVALSCHCTRGLWKHHCPTVHQVTQRVTRSSKLSPWVKKCCRQTTSTLKKRNESVQGMCHPFQIHLCF